MSETFGEYQLLKLIATGGMAEIYLAELPGAKGFARRLVIKRMLPQLAVRQDFVDMFLDEARLAANLVHPNIVQVHSLGEVDGSYYMAMELIDGPHLGALFAHSLRIRKPLPIDLCAHAVARSADGLHFAHERVDPDKNTPLEIVHRDISPQNILVSRHGDVKVTDFGVAKAASQSRKTRTGIIKGKVSYMSPEQCLGDVVNPQTDVFALGIVLYELLTRRRLFREKSDLLVMQRITTEKIKAPSALNPAIDSALDAITMKALERDLKKRYQSASEFADAIDVWLAKNGHIDGRSKLSRWIKAHGEKLRVGPPSEHSISNPRATSTDLLATAEETLIRNAPEETVATPALGSSERPRLASLSLASESSGTLIVSTPQDLDLTAAEDTVMDPRRTSVPSLTEIAPPPTPLVTEPDSVFPEVAPNETGSWLPPPAPSADKKAKAKFPIFALLVPILLVGLLGGAYLFLKDDGVTSDPNSEILVDKSLKNPPGEGPDRGEKPPAMVDNAADAGVAAKPSVDVKPLAHDSVASLSKPDAETPKTDATAEADLVTLKIRTLPSGVDVALTGHKTQKSPFEIQVKAGSTVGAIASFDGQPAVSKTISNISAQNSTLSITGKGKVLIESNPSGATVRVARREVCKTPYEGWLELGKTFDVSVSKAGYSLARAKVKAETAKTAKVSVALKTQTREVRADKSYGRISVFSKVYGKVYIDGKLVKKQSPLNDYKIATGKHVVRVVNADPALKIDVRKTVTIKKGESLRVVFKFKKVDGKWVKQ